MKTILFPTDFSETAENALHYAVELAKFSKAKLVLFHAYHIPVPTTEYPVMLVSPQELEKENRDRIKALEKKIEQQVAGTIKVESFVCAGFVPDEILEAAKAKKASLIVMGITGGNKTAQALIGSQTVSVIKRSKTPVLAIPANCTFRKVEKIVFACDYQQAVPQEIVHSLKTFAALFHAKVLVLDVVKPETVPVHENAVAGVALASGLSDIDHSLYFPEGEDVTSEINSFVDTYRGDWLVMMPHRHTLLEKIFHKSNVRKMAFHTHIPLLSLHE